MAAEGPVQQIAIRKGPTSARVQPRITTMLIKYGTNGGDFLQGLSLYEDYLIFGLGGDDTINGLNGNDQLFGGAGNDNIHGHDGKDFIGGGDGDDLIDGGAHDDVIYGGNDNDKIWGGGDNDKLYGESGTDTLKGGVGMDALDGGTGDDYLLGESGKDSLFGGSGKDWLTGGKSSDTLTGGQDADSFVFHAGDGIDVIKDFQNGIDKIYLIGIQGFDSLQDIFANQVAAGTQLQIDLGGGHRLLIDNYAYSQISYDDFVFL
jgi:Ca2+-binding RTX toxin-like protein